MITIKCRSKLDEQLLINELKNQRAIETIENLNEQFNHNNPGNAKINADGTISFEKQANLKLSEVREFIEHLKVIMHDAKNNYDAK